MGYRIKYIILGVLISFICITGMSGAKADEISDLENQITDNEERYEDIQNKLDELSAAKDDLQAYIAKLNETYASIEQVVNDLDSQIATKNSQIEEADKSITLLDNEIAQQYENMKLRIKYMYESSNASYLDVFLSSETMGEMLERMEYISSIMAYDKQQMDEYELNLREAEELKAELETQKQELAVLMDEQQEQIANLDTMMAEATANIAAHQEQMAEAEAAAQAIEDEIEAQKNTVEKLKEEEERRKQELANGTNNTEKIPYQELDGDIKRMAAIIWCEARGESYEGQVAVGTVVMNRVESPRFPNTIEEVIAQKGQFSPYRSGKYAIALAMPTMQQSCIDAAIEVIRDGKRLGPWLFFRMKNGIINGTFIGNHVFY